MVSMMNNRVNTMNGWNISIVKAGPEVYVFDVNAVVARFKYDRPMTNAKAFVKFLTANFTPAEYFSHFPETPPLAILRARGYKSPNELRRMVAEK